MKKEIKVPWRLFLSLLIFGGLFVSMVWLVAVLPASAMPDAARQTAAAVPQAPMADPVWCVAGGFQSPNVWDLDDSPLYDDGTHGDIVAGDGVFSLDYEIASAGRYEFKVLTCGDWGTAFPYANSWLNTTAVNESVKFTFDTNNHSSDAGPALAPAQNIVNVWDSSSFIAVGDVVGWDNTATANALVNVGNGVYVFTATVPTAGAHEGKIVSASTWDTVTANGRIAGDTGSGNYGYTTTSDNQSVIYYLDTKTGRMGIFPQGSTSGNWCVAGGFQSPNEWDNNDNPLYDDGTHGDLIGGDGVFSLDYVIAANGRYEMKALTCGDWDSPNYPSDNAWVVTANNDQTVKFTFDTNNHSSDAGLKLMPAQYIVNAWDSTPNAFTVVGSWQGWNNPSMDTDMSNAGNNYHVVSANFATAGNYEAKLSQTGNWDNQFAADGRRAGRSDGPPPVGFTVWNDGDDVQFYLDANQGRWAIIAPPSGGASQDGLIVMDALGHDSRDALYRTPGGPVITGTAVTLRLRAAMNDLTGAKVRVYNDLTNAEFFLNMTKSASDGTYDYWQATIPATVDSTLFWYRFIAVDGATTAYYEDDASRDGGWGKASTTSQDNSWQLTVYDPSFQTPDWAKNAVIYQIFPDRFRDGDVTNDPAPGRFFYDELDGTIYRSDPLGGTGNPWNEVVCNPRDAADCLGTYSLNFYGGDLQGVRDKLQYLQDLGITTIYFNPIFESPSNHKYDTGNYYDIASDFGDLQTFITLTTEAHNLGMYVILDGVFNHTSSDSMFFDRYSRFDANGDLTSPDGPGVNDDSGACESPDSPYRSWYYFTDVAAGTGDCAGSDGTPLAANYESWFGYDSLPKLNSANPGVRDMIFAGGPDSVAVQWLQYADGWRFDVGGDIDPGHTNAPTNLFWEEFRDTVRAEYPDTYMVIEEWGNASPWLLGNEMDATMNYQYGAAMLSFWRDTTFTDNDHNSGSSVGELKPLKPSELNGRLLNWIERYPPEALYAMMNLLDSHDTNRALFLLDDNAADANDDTLLQNPNYDWSNALARLRGVAILQMTLPGAPTIYYGDEVGLVGPTYYSGGKWEDDPYNRQPYPWLETGLGTPFYTFLQSQSNQDAMYDYYANLT
ncbi:MAG: alpha amylase N-terminal ig-like domain-containing protein, partial [Anaerolineae bacterium]|nr:alpha amylase N-terminal ig-like domain-containing protein [Anaerolineae bacterium]